MINQLLKLNHHSIEQQHKSPYLQYSAQQARTFFDFIRDTLFGRILGLNYTA